MIWQKIAKIRNEIKTVHKGKNIREIRQKIMMENNILDVVSTTINGAVLMLHDLEDNTQVSISCTPDAYINYDNARNVLFNRLFDVTDNSATQPIQSTNATITPLTAPITRDVERMGKKLPTLAPHRKVEATTPPTPYVTETKVVITSKDMKHVSYLIDFLVSAFKNGQTFVNEDEVKNVSTIYTDNLIDYNKEQLLQFVKHVLSLIPRELHVHLGEIKSYFGL